MFVCVDRRGQNKVIRAVHTTPLEEPLRFEHRTGTEMRQFAVATYTNETECGKTFRTTCKVCGLWRAVFQRGTVIYILEKLYNLCTLCGR